jgi:pimeloyl-ACP methyl ester carboxylesterase
VPPFYDNKRDLLKVFDQKGSLHAVRNASDWQIRRQHILAGMEMVMGAAPKAVSTPPVVRVDESADVGYFRQRIRYEAEPGDWVTAYRTIPKSAGRHPAMVCLHQTTRIGKEEPEGLGGIPDLHYCAELASRGYVTVAPDYPNFGDYTMDPYAKGYVSASMKGIVNHRRAVDLLVSMPEVDPTRIGVIGHSLGGHNSLFVAAFDERIKAVVTSCGFTEFPAYMRGDLTGWTHRGYMPRIASEYGKDPRKMPFDFTEVLAAIAPRAVFINAPISDSNFDVEGVRTCVRSATPVYQLLRAADRLVARYPDVGHQFPMTVREEAYRFLDRVLR